MKAHSVLSVRACIDKSDVQFQVNGNGDDAEADSELADFWMESVHNAELADYLCMALFRRLPYASQKAFQWMASEKRMETYTGFRLMSHLFTLHGTEMNERSRNEFIDQAHAALQGNDLLIKQAAQSALERYEAYREELGT